MGERHRPHLWWCVCVRCSIWLMPDDNSCDPDEGEMDILEMVGGLLIPLPSLARGRDGAPPVQGTGPVQSRAQCRKARVYVPRAVCGACRSTVTALGTARTTGRPLGPPRTAPTPWATSPSATALPCPPTGTPSGTSTLWSTPSTTWL